MINSPNTIDSSIHSSELNLRASTIIFWANQGAMYQGLVQAMQAHLPDHDVLLVERLPDREIFTSTVRLVLLDLGLKVQCASAVASSRDYFPHAALGLVMRDVDHDLPDCDLLFGRGEVQGLLPLDLKLEVWLAAMSLLVQGGEYYPPVLSRRHYQSDRATQIDLASNAIETSEQPGAPLESFEGDVHLTRREREVLELVSEGYQNKLIADRMALSEHTVKVHVHNLITKMHVSNRTQAAAAFRSGRHLSAAPPRSRSVLGSYQYPGRP
ncbi:MAG: hypothetical protein JWP99_222 [Devosia sp.]|nr:hypothetical protein [Devosia sp.]